MPEKYYISDWHYGHSNSIEFDNRPFVSVEQMNEALVQNWNDIVKPEDTVYVLGDMFWCNANTAADVMDKLNGHKFLIKGNHDRCKDAKLLKKFVMVTDYLEIEDKDRRIVLCHYPIPCFKNHYYGWYHLYGHVHNSFEARMMEHDKYLMEELYGKKCLMFNVGAMMPWMQYTPRTLDYIVEKGGMS